MDTFTGDLATRLEARIIELEAELEPLRQALAALTEPDPPPAATADTTTASRPLTNGTSRADQVFAMIAGRPGITSGEVIRESGTATYGYKLLARLEAEGRIAALDGGGWRAV